MSFKIHGPNSMFSRLIEAKYPFKFLDTQYRMHASLMKVPNTLFYNNTIKCGYTPNEEKQFLYAKKPFLFIDVNDGRETLKGTSFMNWEEVEVLYEFTELVIQEFSKSQKLSD